MRRLTMALVALSLLATVVAGTASFTGAQEQSPRPDKPGDGELFAGKPVYLNSDEHAFWFESVRLQTLGKTSYFVGVNAKLAGSFSPGKKFWVRQDAVTVVRPYENMNELKEEYEAWARRARSERVE